MRHQVVPPACQRWPWYRKLLAVVLVLFFLQWLGRCQRLFREPAPTSERSSNAVDAEYQRTTLKVTTARAVAIVTPDETAWPLEGTGSDTTILLMPSYQLGDTIQAYVLTIVMEVREGDYPSLIGVIDLWVDSLPPVRIEPLLPPQRVPTESSHIQGFTVQLSAAQWGALASAREVVIGLHRVSDVIDARFGAVHIAQVRRLLHEAPILARSAQTGR